MGHKNWPKYWNIGVYGQWARRPCIGQGQRRGDPNDAAGDRQRHVRSCRQGSDRPQIDHRFPGSDRMGAGRGQPRRPPIRSNPAGRGGGGGNLYRPHPIPAVVPVGKERQADQVSPTAGGAERLPLGQPEDAMIKTKEARQEIIQVTVDEYIQLWDRVIQGTSNAASRNRLAQRANQQLLCLISKRGSDSYWQ